MELVSKPRNGRTSRAKRSQSHAEPLANPFETGFGEVPAVIAGRDDILSKIDEIVRFPSHRVSLRRAFVFGERGTGKTVLLHQWRARAEAKGWKVLWGTAAQGRLPDVLRSEASRLLGPARSTQANFNVHLPVLSGGITTTTSASPPAATTAQVFEAVLESNSAGLLVCVDEAHDIATADLATVGDAYQIARRGGRNNIAVMFAGLPHAYERLQAEAPTFLRRLKKVHLGFLSEDDSRHLVTETLAVAGSTIDDDALDLLVSSSVGWPYVIQVLGEFAYQHMGEVGGNVTLEHCHQVLPGAMGEAGNGLIGTLWNELSANERRYLVAVAADDGRPTTSPALRRRLGASSKHLGVYRNRLIGKGLIVSVGRGEVQFSVPFIDAWVRDRAGGGSAISSTTGGAFSSPEPRAVSAAIGRMEDVSQQVTRRCGHYGVRSQKPCIRPAGHSGAHRYR